MMRQELARNGAESLQHLHRLHSSLDNHGKEWIGDFAVQELTHSDVEVTQYAATGLLDAAVWGEGRFDVSQPYNPASILGCGAHGAVIAEHEPERVLAIDRE